MLQPAKLLLADLFNFLPLICPFWLANALRNPFSFA